MGEGTITEEENEEEKQHGHEQESVEESADRKKPEETLPCVGSAIFGCRATKARTVPVRKRWCRAVRTKLYMSKSGKGKEGVQRQQSRKKPEGNRHK